MELLESYKKEVYIDIKMDQINILDKQLELPTLKHKWVSRLVDAKKRLNALNKKKKEIKKGVLATLEKDIPKSLPKSALEIKIDSSESIQKINDEIEDAELLIEYLEKVEKIFSSMSFDSKNIIDLIKMETT